MNQFQAHDDYQEMRRNQIIAQDYPKYPCFEDCFDYVIQDNDGESVQVMVEFEYNNETKEIKISVALKSCGINPEFISFFDRGEIKRTCLDMIEQKKKAQDNNKINCPF